MVRRPCPPPTPLRASRLAMAEPTDGTSDDRRECTACRGTGKVSSSLGGSAHEVQCPWCAGTGRFQPGRDAQERPAEAGGA